MTDTEPSNKRAEANRRNAQKSTGPRTAEGKARSRFNAVKHGMRAQADVLPGEDPSAFQARLDRWTTDLKPADEVETFLVGRAVRLSWQLERADRAIDGRDADDLAARRADQADEVLALGRRLFWDPRGPDILFPHWTQPGFLPRRVSWSGQVDDPDDPARLLSRLESTATGCAWLLDRWAELRAVLEEGAAWQPPERFRAVRLLGRQPLDLLADGRVLTVYLAGTVTGTAEAHEFLDVVAELNAEERERFVARLRERVRGRGRPADDEAARAELLELVAAEEARLEGVLAVHLEGSAGEAGGFDAGNEGERLRRYQQACDRGLLRVLESLRKRQRERQGGGAAGGRGPAAAGADRVNESRRRMLELMTLMGPEGLRKALRPNEAAGGPAPDRPAPTRSEGPPPPTAAVTNEANDPADPSGRRSPAEDRRAPARPTPPTGPEPNEPGQPAPSPVDQAPTGPIPAPESRTATIEANGPAPEPARPPRPLQATAITLIAALAFSGLNALARSWEGESRGAASRAARQERRLPTALAPAGSREGEPPGEPRLPHGEAQSPGVRRPLHERTHDTPAPPMVRRSPGLRGEGIPARTAVRPPVATMGETMRGVGPRTGAARRTGPGRGGIVA